MLKNAPPPVIRLFWGDDLKELSWSKHQRYIIQTILDKGDESAVKWLFKKIKRSKIKTNLDIYKLSPKSKNFWRLYL